ncbi:NUDIX hydrolase [Hyphomicrobium denitrificans 1NES1]|uniref:NUDIX hydrolase n=1 Tax=Hyphomicrobium denitrificans 1NES1 TaxID=670307 RepID=N0BFP4_9HYPH|nr:CoA pyrophosphatase [Hyphomicrobium denitrificans]AGK58925.1 NUDIX hydrolase [Hyphomicrobium denitrificans 1NES1]
MPSLSASNVTTTGLDAELFEKLARSRLLQDPPIPDGTQSSGDDELNPDAGRHATNLCPAAVLIPIVSRAPLSIVLTERTKHLPAHAGQIAFPGGKVEAHDMTPLATALREAREEIALDDTFIEPLGYLPTYRTGTGFIITPAVALVRPGFKLVADPAEVADIFEVPLQFLMDEANHRIDSRNWRGNERRFYAMPYGERYIWGATAGIIRALYRRLFSA